MKCRTGLEISTAVNAKMVHVSNRSLGLTIQIMCSGQPVLQAGPDQVTNCVHEAYAKVRAV
jgi:hypothetical protein